jgi:cation diffusion facilitator family transporter
MAAESLHSVADSGNQVLLLVGRHRARRARSAEHQFGFGGERYFYAFLVAVVIFLIGAVLSAYEGVHRIMHPERISSPAVAFAVLGIALVLEGFSLRTAVTQSNASRGGQNWLMFIRRAKAPELPAVLLEDMAALTGLLFALAGVSLSVVTGNGRFDGAGSLAIAVLLAVVAVMLASEMKSLLIGEAASSEVQRAIVTALEGTAEVQRVIHLRTLHLGPETLLVTAKIAVSPELTAKRLAEAIDEAEGNVRAAVPIAELIYLEPDLFVAARASGRDPAVRAARLGFAPPLRRRGAPGPR